MLTKNDFMGKLSKQWHDEHPMPKQPSVEQRIEWHIAHQQNCSCRGIPAKLALEIKKRSSHNPNKVELSFLNHRADF